MECNYEYEARCQIRFEQLIQEDPDFKDVMHVPSVVPELCSESVLCSEWVPGVHIDKASSSDILLCVMIVDKGPPPPPPQHSKIRREKLPMYHADGSRHHLIFRKCLPGVSLA